VIHIVNPSDPKGQHQVVELKPEEVPSKILGRPATRKKWYITGLCFSEDASKLFVGKKIFFYERKLTNAFDIKRH